jgi:hypothetical protein
MTLNIVGIDEDSTNPVDQFWTAAEHVLIRIARVQPKIGQAVDSVIDDGGDIEITAHNQAGRITVTLVEASGPRHVLFDNRQTSDHKERGHAISRTRPSSATATA